MNTGKWLTAIEATIYFLAFTALAIATAAFLWQTCEGNLEAYPPSYMASMTSVCNDPYTIQTYNGLDIAVFDQSCTNTVNVYQRFTNVLQIYFAFFIVQWFRVVLIYFSLCKPIAPVLRLFDCLGGL